MLDAAGLERGVLVQPAHYGEDHSCLFNALRQGNGKLRGIGLATAKTPRRALDEMQAVGVCGLRFTEMRNPNGSVRAGSVGAEDLRLLAGELKARGWQAHLWATPPDLDALLPSVIGLGIPIVVDHMAMVDVRSGVNDPTFLRLLELVRVGAIWVKLTVCRVSNATPDYADVRPFHDALVAANPERLLWGSDWPFIRLFDRAPDVGRLLDLFHDWVPDGDLRRTILVDNPLRLFGFASAR